MAKSQHLTSLLIKLASFNENENEFRKLISKENLFRKKKLLNGGTEGGGDIEVEKLKFILFEKSEKLISIIQVSMKTNASPGARKSVSRQKFFC